MYTWRVKFVFVENPGYRCVFGVLCKDPTRFVGVVGVVGVVRPRPSSSSPPRLGGLLKAPPASGRPLPAGALLGGRCQRRGLGPDMGFTLIPELLLAALLLQLYQPAASTLQEVTGELFASEARGTVAAFGDFNSDKQTDIFLIRAKNQLVILLADLKAPYFKPKPKVVIPWSDLVITSVVPGDYDGDSQMDVLLTLNSTRNMTGVVFWGNNQTLDPKVFTILSQSFLDEPLVLDFNGDMIPDIFGTVRGNLRPQICSMIGRNQTWFTALDSVNKMYVPHSHAFIDLNKDFTADLFLTTMDANEIRFEIWENKDGNFSKSLDPYVTKKPPNAKKIGQSTFADFDGDGQQDHLLPVCMDDSCHESAIYRTVPGSDKWIPILSNLKNGDTIWGFTSREPTDLLPYPFPISIHIGDYNMDGFPDALAILKNTSGSNKQAFLLENVPCSDASCQSVGRMFRVLWDLTDLNRIKNAVVATFFDIYEDGILDVLVLNENKANSELTIHALRNNFDADAYFVKVIVLSGLCSSDCPRKVTPFGVNQPGPYIMYTTADANGYLKNASAGQLSQSAHFALQLPYVVLGLGRSANFLDHLFVGIPRAIGTKAVRKQEWTAIIPNSQLIVIPYPHNSPKSWSAKLYLTPSNIVLLTAIALIGVCVFILAIIGILHWQEKKADDREKRQEAHRFHFDAM
ncbi:T-cell immunomodulatory protein [Leucoraja erinacea]|uniref:T-cell immunomodulatory protein n=1 Tax=Leucoraja erinaceus TaxID=7782 RepID=UPI002454C4C3|nr:T-cell immunomodulatory protein [Leucoraja erinacea]